VRTSRELATPRVFCLGLCFDILESFVEGMDFPLCLTDFKESGVLLKFVGKFEVSCLFFCLLPV
jgi:hypothetical protein